MHEMQGLVGWDVLGRVGLFDLCCGLLIIGSVIGGLRRRSLLGAIGSGLGTAVLLWLLAGASLVWAPPSIGTIVRSSELLTLVPPPVEAFQQLQRMLSGLGTTGA